MPKMKTDTGAKKRFKITGTGKIRRRRRVQESHARKEERVAQASSTMADVAPGDLKNIKRLLGR